MNIEKMMMQQPLINTPHENVYLIEFRETMTNTSSPLGLFHINRIIITKTSENICKTKSQKSHTHKFSEEQINKSLQSYMNKSKTTTQRKKKFKFN